MTQTYISIITGHTIRQYKNDILIYGAFYRYICKSPLIPFCIWKKAEADNPILQLGAKAQRGKNNFPSSIPNLSTPSLYLLKLNILSCLQRQLMLTDTYEFWETPGKVAKFDQVANNSYLVCAWHGTINTMKEKILVPQELAVWLRAQVSWIKK